MAEKPKEVRIRVGATIQRMRVDRGWSQEDLAAKVGNSVKHIGQIERGQISVGLDILTKTANSLSVSVADLLGGSHFGAAAFTEDDVESIESTIERLQRLLESFRKNRK